MARPTPARPGFTLVEMLVVLILMGLAAALPVAAQREEVVSGRVVLTRRFIDVGAAPGIERDGLLQIGSPPVQRNRLPRGLRLQRVEALLRGRIGTAVETVVVERQAEQL